MTQSRDASRPAKPFTICLAGSGGGHVRQLLDLEPFWGKRSAFFVTEDTPLGRSLAENVDTSFVAHYAFGQLKTLGCAAVARAAWANLRQSLHIIRTRRPDLLVTTGAGSQFFVTLFARAFGATVVVVDSFARFKRPSLFARLAGWLAHHRVSQSAEAGAHWRGSRVFDPFRITVGERPPKDPLMLVTVGATLPFERLVSMVSTARKRGLIPEEIVVQYGVGGSPIKGATSFEGLGFEQMKDYLRRADLVVCHGGTGSLITALQAHCRVIAVPRLAELHEHYDDHQREIVTAFEQRGLISVAVDDDTFAEALAAARKRDVRSATTQPSELIDFLTTVADDEQADARKLGK